MATKMQMADMRFVDGYGPDAQKVAVLEKPFHMVHPPGGNSDPSGG